MRVRIGIARRSVVMITLASVIGSGLAAHSSAALAEEGESATSTAATQDFQELSRQYSDAATAQNPALRDLLDALDLQYLNQLDPAKVYSLDPATKAVTVDDAPTADDVGTASSFFGLGSVVSTIRASGGDIVGQAKTVITCPLGSQTANVSGFMASTVSRDPRAGIRNGVLYVDNFLTSASQVDFTILKAAGGARNPINRTAMETTHTGSCSGDVRVQNVVATWPPLRISLAVDDTGSMSNELAGVQGGLAEFIRARATEDYDQRQRGVSYELISFKDGPTLRLANTEDPDAAIAAVNSLYPDGGDDCPEDALGAVGMALSNIASDDSSAGEIVLVTDASPRSGDISSIVAQAQSLGVPVHVMLSGDCASAAAVGGMSAASDDAGAAEVSARVVFEQLARETGGMYFFRPGGTAQDYADILGEIFRSAVDPDPEDTQPPAVTVTATPTTLWPPNHKMVPIRTTVAAVDDTDPAPTVELVGVSSSQPDDGQGDGATEGDVEITDAGEIRVRAERSGSGGRRIYTITYRATDSAGNIGFGSIDIVVPHRR